MMTKFARIESGIVAEFFETDGDIYDIFSEEMLWVEVPSGTPIDIGWTWDGVNGFAAPLPDLDALAESVRGTRDSLLTSVYDRGVMMALREQRMTDPADTARLDWIVGKLAELDIYAVALQNVPEQPGFPLTVIWPVQPTVE